MTEKHDILYRRSGKDVAGEINTILLFISREGQEYLSNFVTRMICAWVTLTRSRLVHMTMLCFNFIISLNSIFFCFKLIIIHCHTQKQKKRKFKPRIKLNHNNYFEKAFKKERKSVRDNPLRFLEYMYDETILVSQINKHSKLAMPSLCTLTNLDNLLMSEDVWERGCFNSAVLVELEKNMK